MTAHEVINTITKNKDTRKSIADYKDTNNNNINSNIINNNSIDVCPEPEPSPDLSGIQMPLVDGTSYDVPLSRIEKWSAAYPAVDVRQQLQRMIAWLDANPQRRKTKRGIDRFINTWLSKEQDRGGNFRNGSRQQSPGSQQSSDIPDAYKEMYDKYLGNRKPSPDDPFQ